MRAFGILFRVLSIVYTGLVGIALIWDGIYPDEKPRPRQTLLGRADYITSGCLLMWATWLLTRESLPQI